MPLGRWETLQKGKFACRQSVCTSLLVWLRQLVLPSTRTPAAPVAVTVLTGPEPGGFGVSGQVSM